MDFFIIFGAKYLFVLIILTALVYFFTLPKNKKRDFLLFSLIALPTIYIVAKISSLFFYDPRPFVSENIVPLLPHIADNGFPSDHTLISATIAMIVFFYNKKIGALLLIIATIVGISRVLAGVHHPIDIIASFFIAIIVSSLIYFYILPLISRLFQRKK